MTALVLLPLALFAALPSCGGDDQERDPPPARIVGTVDLDRPRAAGATFAFTGRVRPADSAVTVENETGDAGSVVVEPSGRFSAAVDGLRMGRNAVRLRASRPGHRPWAVDIRVVRGGRRTVRVPDEDTTPPIATLRVVPPGGAPPVLTVSPSARGDRSEPITLAAPRFAATAVARDDDGGTGRIRVATQYEVRCGARLRRIADIRPPAQIQNVAVAPGVSAPAERARHVRVELEIGAGCTAQGDVSSEATNAHGLQAVSRHVRFRYEAAR